MKHKKMEVAIAMAKMATQKEICEGVKASPGSIVDVAWLDACAHMNVDKIDIGSLQDLLCLTHTIGRVVAQDDDVICIATNISEANGADLLAIPIKWVKMMQIIDLEQLE